MAVYQEKTTNSIYDTQLAFAHVTNHSSEITYAYAHTCIHFFKFDNDFSKQLSTLTHLISLKTNSPKILAASYIILIELYVCANVRWEEKRKNNYEKMKWSNTDHQHFFLYTHSRLP